MSDGSDGSRATANRYIVLATLFVVYTLNFLDRQIVGILAIPIKQELRLTDFELGLMGGLAFALFYSVLGVPIARLADRYSRKWIIACALATWSGFTALCGLATGFISLFLARVGVGVGEAGGSAPSFSLLADYFPPFQRGRAVAVMMLAIPVGSALGLLVGGYFAAELGWRMTFILVGTVGIVFAPIFVWLVHEPKRGGLDIQIGNVDAPATDTLVTVLKFLFRHHSFWLMTMGGTFTSVLNYGLMFWFPAFIQRSHEFDLRETAGLLASITIIGGVFGILLGGFVSDWMAKRDSGAYVRVPALALIIALPSLLVALLVSDIRWLFSVLLVQQAMTNLWIGPVTAAVQNVSPPMMRATATAIYTLCISLVGLGGGAALIGGLSDMLATSMGDQSLRYAMAVCGTAFYPAAAICFYLACRRMQ